MPEKHSYVCQPGKCDYWTHRCTDRQMPDKVIPMCQYALEAIQKYPILKISTIEATVGTG